MEDLLRALDENPSWTEALRSRLLSRELINLPEKFAQLTERVDQLTERLDQLTERMDRLTERVDQLTERMDRLTERVDHLAETVAQLVVAVGELQEGQRRMEARQDQFAIDIGELQEGQRRMEARQDKFEATQQEMLQTQKGFQKTLDGFKQTQDELIRGQRRLETIVGDLQGAFARRVAVDEADEIADAMGMRFLRVLDRAELRTMAASAAARELPTNDRRSFRRADLVIEVDTSDGPRGYIAVEVSYTADARDTSRAIRNADYLTRFTGQPAYAAVAASRRDRRVDQIFEQGQAFWYELEPDSLLDD